MRTPFVIKFNSSYCQESGTSGYIIENEKDIGLQQPGPHEGGGITIGFSFFQDVSGLDLAFRKRILQPGSSIGYHLQENDEIYYILKGKGQMTINGKTHEVSSGDAILTRPGNWHGLKPAGDDELIIFIIYGTE